jgi:pimeloyl-ACP methyl ester carboxylesterase
MANKSPYQAPMPAWPSLTELGKTTALPNQDLSLFFFEAGDPADPAIVMIHGLGDEADTWRHQILPLAKDHHVIALDLPGFGRSDHPKRAYDPHFMMSAILGLMDALGLEKATLMGSSLGGILSQGIALSHPERLSGLILVDGALYQPDSMTDRSLQLMQIPLIGEMIYTRFRKDPEAAYDSLRVVYHDLDALPEADRDFLYTRVNQRVWSDGQRRAYFSTLRKLMPWVKNAQADLPKQLTALPIPTLVIRGELDPLFSAENASAIQSLQPDVEILTISGMGHLPQQEDPDAFLKGLTEWLHKKGL